jgi:hypothetical protein
MMALVFLARQRRHPGSSRDPHGYGRQKYDVTTGRSRCRNIESPMRALFDGDIQDL